MNDFMPDQSQASGLAPGTPMYVGKHRDEPTVITVLDYDKDQVLIERETATLSDLHSAHDTLAVTWVNVTGLNDIPKIKMVGDVFEIHPLLLEDLLNIQQRPKVERQGENLVVILKMLHWHEQEINIEQIGLVLNQNFVVTFQEKKVDILQPLHERIRRNKGHIREHGADFLAYAILDMVVDHYFVILEQISDYVEGVEEELLVKPTYETSQKINLIRRQLLLVRRAIWPLREVLSSLQRDESTAFAPENLIYLRDVYEHAIQVIDTVETFRELTAGMKDTYLSSVSNKMNEVMQLLTVISTVFIPLTFITGLYGMNFAYMPELQWKWGYPMIWGVMLTITVGLLMYFKRKRWL